jgi:hypothetical protein
MKLSTIKSALALSAVTAALVFASGSVSAQQHIAEQMLEKTLQEQTEQLAEDRKTPEKKGQEANVTSTDPTFYGIEADTLI